MATNKRPRQARGGSRKKRDVYGEVTAKIVTMLESGTIPWRRPWASLPGHGEPRNLASGKAYRGINAIILSVSPYASPWWVTYRQAKERGGHVREGERGTLVVFWRFFDADEGDDVPADGEGKRRRGKRAMLRHYTVFNVEQCDGLAIGSPTPEARGEHRPIDACEKIVTGMPARPRIDHAGDRAYYQPLTDRVCLPRPETFDTPAAYYGTLFHELTHSTGHKSRLNREGITGLGETHFFGDPVYSQEELIAEMGAAFLCATAGIDAPVIENQAAYLQSWIKRLRGDHRLAIQAAGAAQKAADFILNRRFDASE